MMTVFSAYRLQSLIGRRRRKPRSAWRTKGLQRLSASVADRTGVVDQAPAETKARLQRLSASVADRTYRHRPFSAQRCSGVSSAPIGFSR